MDPVFSMYSMYLVVSVAMTIWVARTLSKNGGHFLVDVFGGDAEKADATNHLLVVGFYLINFGYICFNMAVRDANITARSAVEALSWKVGMVLVVLGGMHFFNLYVFSRIRRATKLANEPVPPLSPTRAVGVTHAVASGTYVR